MDSETVRKGAMEEASVPSPEKDEDEDEDEDEEDVEEPSGLPVVVELTALSERSLLIMPMDALMGWRMADVRRSLGVALDGIDPDRFLRASLLARLARLACRALCRSSLRALRLMRACQRYVRATSSFRAFSLSRSWAKMFCIGWDSWGAEGVAGERAGERAGESC